MKKFLLLTTVASFAVGYFASAQNVDSLGNHKNDSISRKVNMRFEESIIRSRHIFESPEYNFTKLLDGQAPGIQTTNGSGQPRSSSDIVLRGMSGLSSGNAPLIILDGFPYYGDLSSININDIANITVLKDASATFEFGNMSGNGIITVNTKSSLARSLNGNKQKIVVTAQFGMATPALQNYKTLHSKDYLETLNGAMQRSGLYPNMNVVDYLGGYNPYNVANNQLIGADGKLNPNAQLRYQDNWADEMKHTGIRQNYNIATSRSNDKGAYYLSTGYINDNGYVKQTNYERFSLRFNGNVNITQWLKAGLRSQAAISNQHYTFQNGDGTSFAQSQLIAPVYPVYYRNANGDKEKDPATGMDKFDWGSPSQYPQSSIGNRLYAPGYNGIGALYLDPNSNKNTMFILNPYLSVMFLKNVTYTADFNYNYSKTILEHISNDTYGQFSSAGGEVYNQNSKFSTFALRQKLVWEKKIDDHNLTLTAGADYFNQRNRDTASTIIGIGPNSYFSDFTRYHNKAFYARADYSFKDKFLAFAGFRRDETLVSYDRWKNNWTVGAGYVISEESFLEYVSWINKLKIKASYGTQGRYILNLNQALIPFQMYPPSGWFPAILPNSGNQFNIGLESDLFRDRIDFEVNVYTRNTSEVLNVNGMMPSSPNADTRYNNKGIELNLTTKNINGYNFSWTTSFGFTSNSNSIKSLPVSLDTFISDNFLYKKGNSVANYYLPEYAGVEAATGRALYYTATANGTKSTTTDYTEALQNGRKDFGSAFPKMYGSIVNSFYIKDFELGFQLSYSLGGKYYDQTYQALMSNGSTGANWSADILNAWSPTNTGSNIPAVELNNINYNAPSSRFLKSASYLNFANFYAGYNFNSEKIKKLKMQSLRVYLTANNLWMIAGRRGMNPQGDFYNNPGYVYGPARNIMLGLNIGI